MCFPTYDISIPSYLNSASNYWGDANESMSRENSFVGEKGAGGGGRSNKNDEKETASLLRRLKNWGKETIKKTSSQINLSLMAEEPAFKPLKNKTMSFSCNDLQSLANEVCCFFLTPPLLSYSYLYFINTLTHILTPPLPYQHQIFKKSNPKTALNIGNELAAEERMAVENIVEGGPRRVLFCCHGSRGDVQVSECV
jgi:hypothetical protein